MHHLAFPPSPFIYYHMETDITGNKKLFPYHLILREMDSVVSVGPIPTDSTGLVWFRGLTPQQQPGSYQGGEMMMKPVFLVEETGAPGGNHRPTAV